MFVTVDAPWGGRREKDMRNKFEADSAAVVNSMGAKVERSQGTGLSLATFLDPSLNWKDLAWLRSITSMKLVLKGIQTAEVRGWCSAFLARRAWLCVAL